MSHNAHSISDVATQSPCAGARSQAHAFQLGTRRAQGPAIDSWSDAVGGLGHRLGQPRLHREVGGMARATPRNIPAEVLRGGTPARDVGRRRGRPDPRSAA